MRIVALLEERHGVGMRGTALPRWLEQRLTRAVRALAASRGVDVAQLLAVLRVEPELVVELANALRVGETRFYRDAAQWEALRAAVLPGVFARCSPQQRVTVLSAGCSTGEEAWTLGMLLAEASARAGSGLPPRVVGVDRSEAALVTARAGVYDAAGQRQLPRELAQRFLEPSVDGSFEIVSELRELVTFQCRDLARGLPPGRYALIVCKNVLIYFGEQAQARLIHQLSRALTEDGVLLVARSEVPLVRALGVPAFEVVPGVTAFRAP